MEIKTTLYDIVGAYQQLMDLDLEAEQMEKAMQSVDDSFDNKIQNIGLVIKTLDAEIEILKKEKEKLSDKQKSREERIKYLKRYAQGAMEAVGKKKVKGVLVSANIQKNAPSLNILTSEHIPAEYMIPQEPKLDRKSLLSDIKNGVVVEGVELKQTESIRFR